MIADLWMGCTGVDRGQLHQGTHQERPVHRHFAAEQHVRAGGKVGGRLQGQSYDQERDD